jgi:hypothetical protein
LLKHGRPSINTPTHLGYPRRYLKRRRRGARHLAIRGTESLGDINANYILALGFPSYLNPQFIQLRTQVQSWITDGVLTGGFDIAGHSLGGGLAALTDVLLDEAAVTFDQSAFRRLAFFGVY